MRIGLLSDTHSLLDPELETHFSECHEIWHAGDLGDMHVLRTLRSWGKPLRAVWGNIDSPAIRLELPEHQRFTLEGMDIWITHIGGYPGKYDRSIREQIKAQPPGLFICGHSHILKVIYDKSLSLLHINPGACGHEGWHQMRTAVRFTLHNAQISDLQIIELGKRGRNVS